MIKQNKYGEVLRTQYITSITTSAEVEKLASDMALNEQISTDYKGREILEFVQNMADAANKSGKDCCGLIKLVGSNIIICNQGTPFNDKGIRSVHHAYQSIKKYEKGSIGNKGLGFRGVLNLADSVEIYSGEFAVKFSKQIAKQELEKIKDNSQIQKTIEESGDETYIPMFAVPLDVDFPENVTKDGKYKIDNVEYDTYIKIHIEDDKKTQDFIKQIEDFIEESSNSMLFLTHLKSLTLFYPNEKLQDVITRISVQEKETISTTPNIKLYELKKSNSEESESYYVCTQTDLTIAVPTEISNKHYVPYVYFPVKKEDDSFPVILHAKNFKITSNRNNFVEQNSENIEVAKKLFDFLLEIACFFANKKYDDLSLKIVKFLTVLNSPFKENENWFYEKVSGCPIVPTITSVYKSLKDGLKRYPNIFSEYINIFKNEDNIVSADIHDKIPDTLKNKVAELSVEEMYAKINEISETLGSDTRAKLFFDWKQFVKDNNCNSLMPKILKYTNGDFFTYDTPEHGKVSMLATDKEIKDIPSWAKNPILCQEDREALYANIGKLGPRYVVATHKDREIEDEYKEDFVGARDINDFLDTFMNKLINNDYNKALDLVVFLVKNRNIANSLNYNQTKLNLPDNNGNVFTADNLYFGGSYNQHNDNICKLFEMKEFISFDKIKPYIDPNLSPEDIVDLFYKYYFVSKTPNNIVQEDKNISYGYSNYLKDALKEKGKIESDFDITKASMPFIKNLSVALNNVKTKADTECILAWINNEESICDHIIHNRKIEVYFRYNRARTDSMETLYDKDNYDKYLLYTTKWLVIEDGRPPYAPRNLLLKSMNDGIASIPADLRKYEPLFKLIGVKERIYEMDDDVFYDILLKLPSFDTTGSISKQIYNNIYMNYSKYNESKCEQKRRFLNEGKLFAKNKPLSKGEFRNVQEVKFASAKPVHQGNCWLIDKNVRNGNADEFKKIFGIEKFEENIKVTKSIMHDDQSEFDDLWNKFKPFAEIYATRNQDLKSILQNLHINLVSYVECDGEEISDLDDYFPLPGTTNAQWYIYLSKNSKLNQQKLSSVIGDIFNVIANSKDDVQTQIELLFLRTNDEDRWEALERLGYDISDSQNHKSIKEAFINALNCVLDDTNTLNYSKIEEIDFANINSIKTMEQIINVLKTYNLKAKDIYDNGFAYDVDFSTYHNSVIKNKMSKIQYELHLYKDIKDGSDPESQKQFFDKVENFDRKLQNISVNESDIDCDYDEYCVKLDPYYHQPAISEQEINMNEIFHKNREKFAETYKDFSDDDLSSFSNEEKSMVLFELFDELKTSIENRINTAKQQDIAQNKSATQTNIYKITIDDEFTAKKPHQISGEHAKYNTRKESGEKIARDKAKKGEEAEEIVYNSFVDNKDFAEIEWVSSTGYKKGKGTRRDDSLGYDISYKFIPENKTYYAEIKSASKKGEQYEFLVSSNEKAFATSHPDSFVFALVLPDEIRILKGADRIEKIFTDAETETYKCAVDCQIV